MPRPKAESGNSGTRRFRQRNPEWQELRNKSFKRSKNYKKNLMVCIICKKDIESTRGRNAECCKECSEWRKGKYMKDYYKKNKKRIDKTSRIWQKNNPDKIKEYSKRQYKKRKKEETK